MAAAPTPTKIGARKARTTLLGKKIGMTQIFAEGGRRVPVTVLQVGPCSVLQVKTPEHEGYAAVQLGFDNARKRRRKPQQAYLDKFGIAPKRFVREVPFVDPKHLLPASGEAGAASEGESAGGAADGGAITVGARVGVSVFKEVPRVDVRGVTKGRGFAGNIRRHHMKAGPKSHGTKNIREPKSTGMHTDPGRVLKGKRMPGQLGAVWRKARNLPVLKIDEGENLLIVKGSVPGPNGGYVYIQESLA